MFAGLAGTVLPFLPGILLIYGCYIFYGFATGWSAYGPGAVVGWGIVTVLLTLLDFYAGSIGAKRYGATKWGVWGSVVGGIVGTLAAGFPGLILGPFAGAVVGELMGGRSQRDALWAGWGTFIGFLAGSLFRIVVALTMIGTFVWWVVF